MRKVQSLFSTSSVKKVTAFVIFLIIIVCVPYFLVQDKKVFIQEKKYNQIIYFDQEEFTKGISKTDKSIEPKDYVIRGGVVPHHLLAGYIIADFFQKLAYQKPSTIILVGPNHLEAGEYKVLSGTNSWNTQYGVIDTDRKIVGDLVEKNLVQINDKVLEEDQSVSAPMSFIAFFMPYAKVVPLLLSSRMTNDDLISLSDSMGDLLKDENIVLVSSVDFSHYLSFDEAQARDLESITSIKKFGCQKLLTYDSQHMDSPASICTLLYSMLNIGATNIEVETHDNSANIQKSQKDNTTSYFSIYFH